MAQRFKYFTNLTRFMQLIIIFSLYFQLDGHKAKDQICIDRMFAFLHVSLSLFVLAGKIRMLSFIHSAPLTPAIVAMSRVCVVHWTAQWVYRAE